VECPTPDTGSNIADFTTNGTTTATSRNQCLVDTVPGYYATDNVYGPALACGYGFYCPGGVQSPSGGQGRISCPAGTTTTSESTNATGGCVAVPTTTPPATTKPPATTAPPATTVPPDTTAPSVTSSTECVLSGIADTLYIYGSGFDRSPEGNLVDFNLGAVGKVVARGRPYLVVSFSTPPTRAGPLTVVVTSFGVSSEAPVQVADVKDGPTVNSGSESIPALWGTTVTIKGACFDDSEPEANTVEFDRGAVGTVLEATTKSLIVQLQAPPSSTGGKLNAVVTSFKRSSGNPVSMHGGLFVSPLSSSPRPFPPCIPYPIPHATHGPSTVSEYSPGRQRRGLIKLSSLALTSCTNLIFSATGS